MNLLAVPDHLAASLADGVASWRSGHVALRQMDAHPLDIEEQVVGYTLVTLKLLLFLGDGVGGVGRRP
jgi:hypothetical protein